MNPLLLAGLVFGNLLWSAHPALGKVVLRDFLPLELAWLRYFGAFLAWAVALPWLARRGPIWPRGASKSESFWMFFVGSLCFAFGPWLQTTGLAKSQAIDNAIIVAIEPLITVALAALFLREAPRPRDTLSFALALGGFALLSGGVSIGEGSVLALGNVMLALSLIGESSFSVLGRKYAGRFHPFALFGATIAGGFAVLTALAWWQGALPIPGLFARLGWDSVLALLWLGPVGTTASYIFWMTALERAPVASVAITLLVQPVFGALWGAIFLGETFSAAKGAGAAFILSGLLVQALPRRRPRSSP